MELKSTDRGSICKDVLVAMVGVGEITKQKREETRGLRAEP